MSGARLKAAALLSVALLAVAGLLDYGVLGSGPDAQERARARAMLSSALEELSKEPAVRYRGALPGSARTTVDAQVTSNGVALGTAQLGSARVRLLTVDRKRFLRADAAFWSGQGVFQPSLARTYARRWVQIGPRAVPALAALHTPAQLSTWLRTTADPDAAEASDAHVDGAPAKRIDLGDGAVYLTATKPYRVLRIAKSDDSNAKSTAALPASPLLASASAASDSDGVDISGLDATQHDALIEDVKFETRKLDKAVNSQIRFTNTPAFSCATGGTCTASTSVSNVAGEGQASGRIQVTLRASMTALGQTRQCSNQGSMAPNATISLSCSASFQTPPSSTPTTVLVVGHLHVVAAAEVNVSRVVGELAHQKVPSSAKPSGLGAAAGSHKVLQHLERSASFLAEELQATVTPKIVRERFVTIAVGVGRDARGNLRWITATSEKSAALPKGTREMADKNGLEVATTRGKMHAEERVLAFMREKSITPITVGAGRGICSEKCAPAIARAGATRASPVRRARARSTK